MNLRKLFTLFFLLMAVTGTDEDAGPSSPDQASQSLGWKKSTVKWKKSTGNKVTFVCFSIFYSIKRAQFFRVENVHVAVT